MAKLNLKNLADELKKKLQTGFGVNDNKPFIQSPVGQKINNFNQNFTNNFNNKVLQPVASMPRFEFARKPIENKVLDFGRNIALGIPESFINIPRNLLAGKARQQIITNNALVNRKAPSLLQVGQAYAPSVEGLIDLSSFGVAKNLAKEGGKVVLKDGIKDAIAKQGIKGMGLGAVGGTTYGLDRQYGKEFNAKQLGADISTGAVLGGVLGGTIGGVGALKGLINRPKEVDGQLRDLAGRYVAGQSPVKPLKMPQAQWEFQLKFNKQYGRNPYTPVYSDDLAKAAKIETEKRIGAQVRDVNANKIPDTQAGVTDAVNPLIQEAKKYGSAEEYIKAQGDRLYKGKNYERAKYFDTPKIKAQLTDIYNQSKGVTKGVESMPVGQKERGFVTSVQEAPKIIGKVKAKVKGIYTPKPNTDLMGEAQALLQDGATIDFKNVQGVDKKVAATIQEALNAQKAGNHQAAANLFNNLAEQGTELGRGVQAFSLLQKMSPEAVSLSVAGKIKKYNQTAMRQIPELTGEQQKVIADQITALDLLKGREKNIALNELQNTINSFIPSSIGDKAIAVWKAGLLTSFRTHERNFLGNLIHGGLEVAKDVPASIADIGLSAVTGQRTKSFTTKGIREFATKDTGQQMKDIISRGYDPSETINKFDYKTITWGNNPVEQALKKYTDVVFRTLGASDKPFYNAALSRSLYDQATTAAINAGKRGNKAFIENLVKNPTEDILKIAIGDANVATFKNKNAATAISSAIKNALKSEKFGPIGSEIGKVVGEITMPFTGVPSSILGQIINYSPAGLLKGIINTGRVALTHVPNLQRQAVEELGRGIIGTGIFGLGAYLASKGLITGQPKDATEQRLWDTQNKPRNSIMLFGKWRSLNSIGPEAVVFLAGAKAQEEMKNPEGSAANYALSLGKDYLDQSFVQGIKAPINALTDPSRYAKSYAGQTISSVIPNLVKDAGKAFDPYMREANTVMDYAKSSTPILRNTMLPSRDVLGRPRTQEPTGIGAFIDVFNSKTPITNDVVNELERLYTTGNNATPGKLNKSQTIGGVKQTLTPAELDQLESTVGEEGRAQLQSLINNSGYQTLSDEDKANAISSLLTGIRKKTRATIKLSPTATDTSVPTATASDTTDKTYILVNQETGTVKQVDLYSPIEYPTLTGITSVDKKLISGYKSDISSRLGDAIKLYDNGKGQITLEQLKDVADQTDNQLAKAKGPKKPKKITIKYTAYKPQKITIKRSSARVNPTIKKPKNLKSTRKYTIKLK